MSEHKWPCCNRCTCVNTGPSKWDYYVPEVANGLSRILGFEPDLVAQEKFLLLAAQAALAASVETGGTVEDVKFCTRATW